MIRAILFDLDGTLIQSEKLKAHSYAIAVQRLRHLDEPEPGAIEAYREIVGSARDVASKHVIQSLNLEAELVPLAGEFGVDEPWQVLTAMRTEIYNAMVADPEVLRDNQWPHTVGLLRIAKDNFCRTGLATMSHRSEVDRVLGVLDLHSALDLVLTREDVRDAKPAPEIYELAARLLEVAPNQCVVIEDSVNGVTAGVSAGAHVIAVATPFTGDALHRSGVVDERWIVDDPPSLNDVVERLIAEERAAGGLPSPPG